MTKWLLIFSLLLVIFFSVGCSSGKDLSEEGKNFLSNYLQTEYNLTEYKIISVTYTDICKPSDAACPFPWYCVKIEPATSDGYDGFRLTNEFGTKDSEWNVTHVFDTSDPSRTIGDGRGRSQCFQDN